MSKERAGRNEPVREAETFSAEPWRDKWWKTAESATDALAHAKSVSGKRSGRAVMTTNVDNCDLDAAKPLRTLVLVRAQFAAKGRNFSVSCAGPGLARVVVCVSLDYTAKILEDAVKLGFVPTRLFTTAETTM